MGHIFMRNKQLIRQWKILVAIADGAIDLAADPIEAVRVMCGLTQKTAWRDLQGLRDAGFLTIEQDVLNGHLVWLHKTYQKPRMTKAPGLPVLVEKIKAVMPKTSSVRDIWSNCNRCNHVFARRENGDIDMREFMRHRKECQLPT